MFEAKMKSRLDKEMEKHSLLISENSTSISKNSTSISRNLTLISEDLTSINKNSTSISENSTSIRAVSDKMSIKSSHVAYRWFWSTDNSRITFEPQQSTIFSVGAAGLLLNSGAGNLETNTGIFTCGQRGTYLVSWICKCYPDAGEDSFIYLYRNGNEVAESYTSFRHNAARTELLSLEYNDTLWLQAGTLKEALHYIMFNVQIVAVE